MTKPGRRALLLLPAIAFGMLSGLAISQRWVPVWAGVTSAVLVGLGTGLLVFRPWSPTPQHGTTADNDR